MALLSSQLQKSRSAAGTEINIVRACACVRLCCLLLFSDPVRALATVSWLSLSSSFGCWPLSFFIHHHPPTATPHALHRPAPPRPLSFVLFVVYFLLTSLSLRLFFFCVGRRGVSRCSLTWLHRITLCSVQSQPLSISIPSRFLRICAGVISVVTVEGGCVAALPATDWCEACSELPTRRRSQHRPVLRLHLALRPLRHQL